MPNRKNYLLSKLRNRLGSDQNRHFYMYQAGILFRQQLLWYLLGRNNHYCKLLASLPYLFLLLLSKQEVLKYQAYWENS